MPHVSRLARQRLTEDFPIGLIKQAELDAGGSLTVDGKVDATGDTGATQPRRIAAFEPAGSHVQVGIRLRKTVASGGTVRLMDQS